MRVALFGGTGFVGGYLVDALLTAGHEPSLLVRPDSQGKLRCAGECRLVHGDISSARAIEETLADCDAAIYNIGLLREFPKQGATFEEAHHEGVRRAVGAAERLGSKRFLLMSANGVANRGTAYQASKARGEDALKNSTLDWTVFRPSLIFGNSYGMQEITHQLYRQLIRPPLPAPAFRSGWSAEHDTIVMSPVSVIDVADAFVTALSSTEAIGKTYALGGPDVLRWEEMIRCVAEASGRRKIVLPLPIGFMKFAALLFDWLPFFPATREQLQMLEEGNTADPDDLELLIGRPPMAFEPANLRWLR